MRVPPSGKLRAGGRAAGWALCLALAAGFGAQAVAADRQPQPWVRLKLDALGFPGMSAALLEAGASVLTVNFVDDHHLLVTFGTRGLVPRVPGDPPDHDDRMVAAEIVDLPSGAVETRTEWHMHDHARYLWSLGGGRFLVRIGDALSTMDTVENLASGKPFDRIALPARGFRPGAIVVSPDKGIVMMETAVKLGKDASEWGDVPASVRLNPVLVEFYRVKSKSAAEGGVELQPAGKLLAPQMIGLPLTADGTLWAVQKPHSGWGISFEAFNGKSVEAGELGSTCDPQMQMVGRSHYVAVTCQGAGGGLNKLSLYGLDGHEAWEEPLGGLDTAVYALAPGAGRFAVLRTVDAVSSPGEIAEAGTAERQELRVYETESGDMLLKTPATPQFRTAENFDLAEDGSAAAVVRDGQIVVYKLDAPDKHDVEDMKRAEAYAAPEAEVGPLSFPRLKQAMEASAAAGSAPRAPSVAAAAGAAAAGAAQAPAAEKGPKPAAEAEQAQRMPPTLLKPGEKPEFGKANAQPLPGTVDDDAPPTNVPQQ